MSREYHYQTCCVHARGEDISVMVDASREVTYATLRRHCEGLDRWACDQGYARHPRQGLVLSQDWAVSYHKSTYRGRPCYYVRHSAIEYIWVRPAA